MKENTNKINIRWENFSVKKIDTPCTIDGSNTIMIIARDPAQRQADETYDIERAMLDYVGEEEFIHHTYEVSILADRSIFVQFSGTAVVIGTVLTVGVIKS